MNVSEDPLVQYLKKQAAGTPDPPMKPKTTPEGCCDTNEGEMELGLSEKELSSEDPGLDSEKLRNKQWRGYLQNVFKNTGGITSKSVEKDKSPSTGVVNKTLGIK